VSQFKYMFWTFYCRKLPLMRGNICENARKSKKKIVGKRSSVDRIPCPRVEPRDRTETRLEARWIVCVCNRYTRKEFIKMRGPRNLIKMELSALGHRLNAGCLYVGLMHRKEIGFEGAESVNKSSERRSAWRSDAPLQI
jgi:hypothetical protein